MVSEASLVLLVGAGIAAVPPTVVALAAFRAAKRVETKTEDNNAITIETKDKVAGISEKADRIHDLTNNNYSELKKELNESHSEIKLLHTQVEQLLLVIGDRRKEDRGPMVEIEKHTKDAADTLKKIEQK